MLDLRQRRVLVTEAGLPQSLAVIRALGRAGAVVVVADGHASSAGFRSRFAAARVLHPSTEDDAEAAVEAIHGAVEEHGIELVVPNTDRITVVLSEQRERFEGTTLALPTVEALERSRDKHATVELAKGLGIRVPRSVLVATVDEAVEVAADVGWPIVLKPQYSHQRVDGRLETFGVTFAADGEELRQRMAALEGRSSVLLQEYVSGTGVGVELLLHEGRALAAFQHRRLREVPPTGGMSALRESVDLDPDLLHHATDLLGSMGWTGLAMVELRVDRGRAHLMEVNGRIWGSIALAVRAGMDFPSRMASLFLDGPPDGGLVTDYRRGVRVRNLELELRWITSVVRQDFPHRFEPVPGRWRALPVALGLLWPGNDFDVQVLDDPRPGLTDARHQLTDLAARARRRRSG